MKLRSVKHKFNAIACKRDSIRFSSKLERSVYDILISLKNSGKILFFLRQIGIDIGGGHRYICDYLIFTESECFFVEVKGKMLASAQLKIDLASEILGVEIYVVTDPVQVFGVINPNNL